MPFLDLFFQCEIIQVFQFFRNVLIGFFQNWNQRLLKTFGDVFFDQKWHGFAGFAGPPGPADPVYVILGIFGHVEINDQFDIIYV